MKTRLLGSAGLGNYSGFSNPVSVRDLTVNASAMKSRPIPLTLVFLGVTVGGIAICMFLPIFKMSDIINGPNH